MGGSTFIGAVDPQGVTPPAILPLAKGEPGAEVLPAQVLGPVAMVGYHGAGDDWLDGGADADRTTGGAGDDTDVVDNAVEQVLGEIPGGGLADTVFSYVTYFPPINVENLTLVGNGAANILRVDTGHDTIDGGGGNEVDMLTGGAGTDVLWLDEVPLAGSIDTITGFSVADDTMWLSRVICTSASAADASDRIIFNSATNTLWYDPDGLGGVGQVQIATLTGLSGPMTAEDFVVV